MSVALKAVLNTTALEADRVRRAMRQGAIYAIPKLIEPQPVEATPTMRGVIDAENIIVDPQGIGGGGTWDSSQGTRSFVDGDTPAGWTRYGRVVAGGGGTSLVSNTFTARTSGVHYVYALVRATVSGSTDVYIRTGLTSGTTLATTTIAAPVGWRLIRLQATLTSGVKYWITHAAQGTPTAGTELHLTGVTVAEIPDPGEPFDGDSAASSEHAYGWTATRGNSISRRYGKTVDLLAEIEEERQFNIVPEGLTWEQRREYLVARHVAFSRSGSAVLRDLLLLLLRTEVPSATTSSVRLVETLDEYKFRVEIAYSETGPLASRIQQLITDLMPAHLRLEDVVWGTFRAGISEAGDPV